jgi:hypothetical protein
MPGHASSYMLQPPQPPSHHVGLERGDAEPLLQRLRRDVVLLHSRHVPHVDVNAARASHTLAVKTWEPRSLSRSR